MHVREVINIVRNQVTRDRERYGTAWPPNRWMFEDTRFENSRLEDAFQSFCYRYDRYDLAVRRFVHTIRRARTGYGGHLDAWSFDVYISRIILAAIKDVRNYVQVGYESRMYGMPWVAFPPDSPENILSPDYTYPHEEDDAAMDIAHAMYVWALDDMIEGFTLLAELGDDDDYRVWRSDPALVEKADRAKMLFIHFYDDLET